MLLHIFIQQEVTNCNLIDEVIVDEETEEGYNDFVKNFEIKIKEYLLTRAVTIFSIELISMQIIYYQKSTLI